MPHTAPVSPDDIQRHPRVSAARDHILATDERTIRDQVELTEIPAPPFGEEARAAKMFDLLAETGLSDVRIDEVGNVIGVRPGQATDPPAGDSEGAPMAAPLVAPLVVAAHMDTVFPSGTDLTVRIEDAVLRAPGITDDGRGLAALLALARAIHAADVPNRRPIAFVGTVGEEGNGDLRGVKHLFREGSSLAGACGFISLDGAGLRTVVNRGLGALRFRVVLRGRGGHSWVDWGVPNPIHALGRAIGALAAWPPPTRPRLSLTVSRFGGGTSVNAIPVEAWAELDVRSESMQHMAVAEERIRAAIDRSLAEENSGAADEPQRLDLEITRIGFRPAAQTPPDSPLVQAAMAATELFGVESALLASSTDANLPMSLGIPAITLGAGGEAGGAHTLDEWYRNVGGTDGICRALYTSLLIAELAPASSR